MDNLSELVADPVEARRTYGGVLAQMASRMSPEAREELTDSLLSMIEANGMDTTIDHVLFSVSCG